MLLIIETAQLTIPMAMQCVITLFLIQSFIKSSKSEQKVKLYELPLHRVDIVAVIKQLKGMLKCKCLF